MVGGVGGGGLGVDVADVAHGGFDGLVAEELLDVVDGGSGFEGEGGGGVAEDVGGAVFDACFFGESVDELGGALAGEGVAVPVGEDGTGGPVPDGGGDGFEDGGAEGFGAAVAPFDGDGEQVAVEVADLGGTCFGDAAAGSGHQPDEGVGGDGVGFGDGDEFASLLEGKAVFGGGVAFGAADQFGRSMFEVSFGDGVGVEAGEAGGFAADGCRGESVVEEPAEPSLDLGSGGVEGVDVIK